MRKTRRARKLRRHKQRGGVVTEGEFKFDDGSTWRGKWNGDWYGNEWRGDKIKDARTWSDKLMGKNSHTDVRPLTFVPAHAPTTAVIPPTFVNARDPTTNLRSDVRRGVLRGDRSGVMLGGSRRRSRRR